MSNDGTPAVIRGEVLEAGLVAPELENGYNRVNVSVSDWSQLKAYPRNLYGLKVVIIAADDYDTMLAERERTGANNGLNRSRGRNWRRRCGSTAAIHRQTG